MEIKISYSVPEMNRRATIKLEDMFMTKKEWNKLSEADKKSQLQYYVDDLPDQPFWQLESFETV